MKVSIIVPVYNAEKYLDRCVESIIKQTEEDIEILLIDDDSTDSSGRMCEEWANKDSRIRVFHIENIGVSNARNQGIKYSNSPYIMFVDSDDWIKEEMIETLVGLAMDLKADIVQSGFYYVYETYLLYDDRYYSEDMLPIQLNKNELMREIVINERVKNFAWGKLYKTNLIKDLYFEKGVLFEDVFWAHKVMDRVDKYVICHKPMCYYLQRNDSIVSTYTVKNLDIIKGLKERHKFIEENYKELVNESYKILTKTILLHYYLLNKNRDKDLDGYYRKELRGYIINNYLNIQKAIKDDKELSNEVKLFKLNYLLSRAYVNINKVLRKVKLKEQSPALKKVNF